MGADAPVTYELEYHFRGPREQMRGLFDELIEALDGLDFEYKVGKTYIGLVRSVVFAAIRIQTRKIIVEFTARELLASPRFTQVKQFQKQRWAYYVNVSRSEEIDRELLDWLRLSHE